MIRTPGFHGYSVKFCHTSAEKIALVGGTNFGLAGNGAVFILEANGANLQILAQSSEPDVITDVSWGPNDESTFCTSNGNGKITSWLNCRNVGSFQAHVQEVSSIDWLEHILTSSWDGSVKIWDPTTFTSVRKCSINQSMVFESRFSRIHPSLIAIGSSQKRLDIWDLNGQKSALAMNHGCDVISLDWHKGNSYLILTGATDGVIRLWDLRHPYQPCARFIGHEYAVKRVVASPHDQDKFLSCSYDLSVRSWSIKSPTRHKRLTHHTEFVFGLDLSPFQNNLAVDCSWDSETKLFHYS